MSRDTKSRWHSILKQTLWYPLPRPTGPRKWIPQAITPPTTSRGTEPRGSTPALTGISIGSVSTADTRAESRSATAASGSSEHASTSTRRRVTSSRRMGTRSVSCSIRTFVVWSSGGAHEESLATETGPLLPRSQLVPPSISLEKMSVIQRGRTVGLELTGLHQIPPRGYYPWVSESPRMCILADESKRTKLASNKTFPAQAILISHIAHVWKGMWLAASDAHLHLEVLCFQHRI